MFRESVIIICILGISIVLQGCSAIYTLSGHNTVAHQGTILTTTSNPNILQDTVQFQFYAHLANPLHTTEKKLITALKKHHIVFSNDSPNWIVIVHVFPVTRGVQRTSLWDGLDSLIGFGVGGSIGYLITPTIPVAITAGIATAGLVFIADSVINITHYIYGISICIYEKNNHLPPKNPIENTSFTLKKTLRNYPLLLNALPSSCVPMHNFVTTQWVMEERISGVFLTNITAQEELDRVLSPLIMGALPLSYPIQ